jgi:cytochrome c oxidase subunit 2
MLFAAACAEPAGGSRAIPTVPSIFDPKSPNAGLLSDFSWLIHAIMAVVFVGVIASLLFIARRYRARAQGERGRTIFGNTRLEIGWTAAPALVVLSLYLLSLNVMCTVDAPAHAEGGDVVRVLTVGRQWWWEYQLPDYGVVTANELHLPVGQTVKLDLQGDDVIHNWWVPQLQGKRYNIPGRSNVLGFTPSQAGVFVGACGEFCGIQHAWMRIRVVVETPEQFLAWTRSQAAPAQAPSSPRAQRGEQLFAARNCAACHVIAGRFDATASAGPSLTHMGSRAIIAAGVLENTPANMARWLSAPQEVKPGNSMPDLRLRPDEVQALVAYLEELR